MLLGCKQQQTTVLVPQSWSPASYFARPLVSSSGAGIVTVLWPVPFPKCASSNYTATQTTNTYITQTYNRRMEDRGVCVWCISVVKSGQMSPTLPSVNRRGQVGGGLCALDLYIWRALFQNAISAIQNNAIKMQILSLAIVFSKRALHIYKCIGCIYEELLAKT